MLIDIITYNLMQATENPATTTATKIISLLFDPITIAVATLAISIYFFLKSQKTKSIILASTILITGVIIKASKEILQVARPPNPIITEASFSLPSGHVTISIVFLGLLTYMLTKTKPERIKFTMALTTALIIVAIIFSRIYLRVHWLTDTLAGFILGLIILTLSIQLYNKTITSPKSNKPQPRSQP